MCAAVLVRVCRSVSACVCVCVTVGGCDSVGVYQWMCGDHKRSWESHRKS